MHIGQAPENGKSDRDCWIEVCAGDMTDGIYHNHYNEAPCHAYTWKCDRAIDFVHSYRTTTSKYHKVGTNNLCNKLLYIKERERAICNFRDMNNPFKLLSKLVYVIITNYISFCSHTWYLLSSGYYRSWWAKTNIEIGFIRDGGVICTFFNLRNLFLCDAIRFRGSHFLLES